MLQEGTQPEGTQPEGKRQEAGRPSTSPGEEPDRARGDVILNRELAWRCRYRLSGLPTAS